jgi:hypothetical protein
MNCWRNFRDQLVDRSAAEKWTYPDWLIPDVSIMCVKYGLRTTHDYSMIVHAWGDDVKHNSDEFDCYYESGFEYDDDSDMDSMVGDEEDNGFDSWIPKT